MTRRGIISIHDYPEHLNPFREDDEETPRKHNRRERAGLNASTRLGSPSQSPAKPERPPLPHRTRHKDKENEVASPDEDKYFRQGAKPKKKRPAPMPPSPNQQKMTPAVSDGSLDSSASSTSPNVTEVPESSATKGQAQSPQKNPAQELNKERDTTSENGKIPLDIVQTSSEEIKRPSEEVKKPSDDGMKPLSEETKLKTDETQLETDEPKSQAEETTSHSEEAKSQPDETKSQSEETKTHSGDKAESQQSEGLKTQDEVVLPNDDRKLQNGEENDPSCNINRTPDRCTTPIQDTTTDEGARTGEEVDHEKPAENVELQEHSIKTLSNETKFQETENVEVPKENGLLEPKTMERNQDVPVIDNQTELPCKE